MTDLIEHADALEFLARQPEGGARVICFDPPYSRNKPPRGKWDGMGGSVYGPFEFMHRAMLASSRALMRGGILIGFCDWELLTDLGYIASISGLRNRTHFVWCASEKAGGTGGIFRGSASPELGSLADVQTGPFGSQLHSSDYVAEGTPIITVEHLIGENEISHDSIPLVSVSDRTRLIRYSLQTGDLVFSRVGAIDRCSYVSPREDGWLFSGRLLRVRPDRSRVDSRFLASYLAHEPSQRWIRAHAVGSTMPCLNTSILKRVPLSLPPLPTQRTIAEILDTTDGAIRSTERLIAKLEQAGEGLRHDLLTHGIGESGELRDPATPCTFVNSDPNPRVERRPLSTAGR